MSPASVAQGGSPSAARLVAVGHGPSDLRCDAYHSPHELLVPLQSCALLVVAHTLVDGPRVHGRGDRVERGDREDETKFAETRSLFETVRFDRVDAYRCADLPYPPSSMLPDKVPKAVIDAPCDCLLAEFPTVVVGYEGACDADRRCAASAPARGLDGHRAGCSSTLTTRRRGHDLRHETAAARATTEVSCVSRRPLPRRACHGSSDIGRSCHRPAATLPSSFGLRRVRLGDASQPSSISGSVTSTVAAHPSQRSDHRRNRTRQRLPLPRLRSPCPPGSGGSRCDVVANEWI